VASAGGRVPNNTPCRTPGRRLRVAPYDTDTAPNP